MVLQAKGVDMHCSRIRRAAAFLAAVCLLGLCGSSLPAQQAGASDKILELAKILGRNSTASSGEVLKAIQEIVDLNTTTTLGAQLLLDRANVLFEADPAVREQAILAAVKCSDKRDLLNRMVALRVVRVASPASEPSPAVRSSALRSLTYFRCVEAASRIIDSTSEVNEPDESVRRVAKELLAQGLPNTN